MRSLAFAVALIALTLAAPASAGPIQMVVVGDSLSDPYSHYQGANNPATGLPYWGSAHDKNWVEQFQGHFLGNVNIYNYAQAGATTTDLLGTSSDKAVLRVKFYNVHDAVVMAGTNDVLAYMNGQLGNDPAAFVAGLANRLNSILTKIGSAGLVHLVVGNIPDLSVTPTLQLLLGGTPVVLQSLSTLVQSANQQIAAVAQAHGAAVVDLYGLSHLFDNPVALAGTTIPTNKIFAPDGFNPASIPQGLISNAIMEAFGGSLGNLLLSDQAILKQGNLNPSIDANPTYFDVSSYVHKTPEPASIVLLGLACCGIIARRRRPRAG